MSEAGPENGKSQHQEGASGAQVGYRPVRCLEVAMRQREEKQQYNAHYGRKTDASSKQRRQHKKSMIQSSWNCNREES